MASQVTKCTTQTAECDSNDLQTSVDTLHFRAVLVWSITAVCMQQTTTYQPQVNNTHAQIL